MSDSYLTAAMRARRLMQEWRTVARLLAETEWPALVLNVESEDEVSWIESTTCPHCSAKREPTSAFAAVDVAVRWTYPEGVDLDAQEVTFRYDGGPEWDGLAYLTTCCALPVSLPEGWTEWA